MLMINPIGERDLDIVKDVGDLNIRPIILLIPIEKISLKTAKQQVHE